jgi:O-antigen/teichoic acid export membrane protein
MNFFLRSARFRRLTKEASWIVAGQIAAITGSLVLMRVLTEYLEPEQYGQLALGLSVAAFFNQVAMGGISAGIVRFYSIAVEKYDLPGYLHASNRLMGYATAVVVAIALVLMTGLLWLGYSQWMGLVAAALVFSVLSGYNVSLSGIQNAARQRAVVAFHVGVDAWLKIFLAICVMIWVGSSSTAVVLGYALSSLIVTCSQLYFLRLLTHPQVTATHTHENWGRQIWLYSWPFATWGVFAWVQQGSDRWALQTFATTQDVGLYALLFQLGYVPIGLVTSMAMGFLAPILYQHSGSASNHTQNASVHRLAWRITFAVLLMTALAFIFTFSQHERIFQLLVASNYHAVSYLLPWVVLAGGLFSASQMLLLKLQSEMKQNTMITAKIVTAIIGVCLNIYGASQFGLQGIVAAIVAFSVITLLWMSWLSQHLPTSASDPSLTSRK